MKYFFKVIYPLVVIATCAGLAMGLTYQLLEKKLSEVRMSDEKNALTNAIGSASSFVLMTNSGSEYYIAYDATRNMIGYVFKEGNTGYGGNVEAVVGITNGAVDSVFILSMPAETPGLGTKAKEAAWLSQFKGLTASGIPASKEDFNNKGLDAVTGATLTSMAVAHDIRKSFERYYRILGQAAPDIITSSSAPVYQGRPQ
jgi:electron transport complex protein RnfG